MYAWVTYRTVKHLSRCGLGFCSRWNCC
jgi:hypothetical protein